MSKETHIVRSRSHMATLNAISSEHDSRKVDFSKNDNKSTATNQPPLVCMESKESNTLLTGASLIPDLNLLVERMRSYDNDRFIYLTYMLSKTSEYFTPYSLKEIPYEALPNKYQYFTMSRHGVTYWNVSENFFTPLQQWQQEFQQFLSIIKIQTFAMFRIWKGFKVWEKTVKWKKIADARRYLEDNLFIAIAPLGNAIIRLRTEIVQLDKINFVNNSVIEEWHPFYFLEIHMKLYERILVMLHDFRSRTGKYLYDACIQAITERGFFPDDEINYYPSIKKMRDAMSFMDRARKRNFCKTLSNFLSYCDHMMYHMLHKLTTNSFFTLAKAMEVHDSAGPDIDCLQGNLTLHDQLEKERPESVPQNPFFLAHLHLLPDRIEVEPSEDVMKYIFNRISNLILETVTEIENFTNDKTFFQFTEPSIMGRQEDRLAGVPPDLNFLLRTDAQFQSYRKAIFTYIRNAYAKAIIYTQRFEIIRNNYNVDTHTDPNVIKNERDLETLRSYCDRYSNNVRGLDGIATVINLGLLKLSQGSFKETISPVCYMLQNVLATHLPKLAADEIVRISEEANELNMHINSEPQTAHEIVLHLRLLSTLEADILKLFGAVDYAHDLLIIIKDFNIIIDDERKEDYMDCEDLVNRTLDKLHEVQGRRAEFIKELDRHMQLDIQVLVEEISEVADEVQNPNFLDKNCDAEEVRTKLNALMERLHQYQEKAAEYLGYQKAFKLDITHYEIMDKTFQEIRMRQNLWKTMEEWETAMDNWYSVDFNELNVEEMINLNTKTLKNCLQFEKYLPDNNIVPDVKTSAKDFKLKLPVLGYLRNPNFKARHWNEIEGLLQKKIYQEEDISIFTFENAHAFDEEPTNRLMELSSQATGEAQLENMLKVIDNMWKETELSIVNHHDQKDVFILAGTEELQTILDDANVNINTIAASKYVAPIKEKVDDWIKAIEQFGYTLEEWTECQNTWIYLEAIFSSPDIQRQLPLEAKMFLIVDKSFKDIARHAKKVALALPVMTNTDTFATLKENNRLLDLITRGLEAYLEVKRVVFPRFYFLSNDELLEILAQTRVPQAVQPHLRKCFDAIYRLEFGQKESGDGGKMIPTNDILAFISPEGEKLLFGKGLKARGAVEEWLSKVEEAMFLAVKRYMRFGYQCYPAKERDEWFQDHPNQVVLTISQQQWAADVQRIIDGNKTHASIYQQMVEYEKKCFKNLAALAALTRKDITALLRKILCALITIDVHAKDSVTMLIEKNVVKTTDFNWLKMLRFYWQLETDTVYSRMASANIPYYYEYLGAGGVLVLTPLTDRCYLCLMGALQMDLGGAPAGPAGTGKTETTKDLAKSVAKQCVVFNCSDGLDYKMMGRFFSGLSQCGAWCCFDEFNRIDIEVLSVIAQQLITIRNAKVANLKRFIFEGREIKLIKSCAVFITMNPGYAGRTELPDNLKALFRPISMMVPDYALIAEVILYSEGFEYPKILAHKMVQMYKLCSEQLSQQNHYDFGMRAVKSVLVMAGSLKRASPNQQEDITLIAALRDSNIPKFLVDDALLFRGILRDLFPGVELPESSHPDLQNSMEIGLRQKRLQTVPATIRKCIQLYETMCVRWGVMLVGPTGGGKSTVLHALEFAFNHLYENNVPGPNFRTVKIQTMNPKAVSMNELYGFVDLKTMEWQDGLLGSAVRNAVIVEDEIHQWIVCDGPVDAVWIENLNTVLDDNKMLCLANSERIKLTAWVHMLFEVQDLAQASPATVSRCGMVYVDPSDLGWVPIIDSWKSGPIAKKLSLDQMQFLYNLFHTYYDKLLRFAIKYGSYTIHQVTNAKVQLLTELLSSMIDQCKWFAYTEVEYKALLCKMFVWAMLWSTASNFKDNEKLKFEQYMRELFADNAFTQFPKDKDSLWDVRIDIDTKDWDSWADIVDEFSFNVDDKYFDMQVPTVDTTKYGYVTEMLFNRKFPVMFTGDTGVGKSVLATTTLKKLSRGNIVPVLLNFSAQTSSARTQEMIEAQLERRKRTQLSAPFGKTVIVFIDDVNMPKLDTYGSQPAIELLRQFLDFQGFYDREKLFWKDILEVVLGCACAPPGGGRNPLTARFVRHFALLALPKPSDETLTTIFNGILNGFLDSFPSAIRNLSVLIVNACVDVYVRISKELLPTPDKSHYIFNLRDLSKCVQGILQASNLHYNMEMQILRLFYHETTRVFHDRLINNDDREMFKQLMNEVCLKHFKKEVVKVDEPPILFGDFMVFGRPKEERIYNEIKDQEKLESILLDYVEDFNSITGKNMHLILFQDALEHTVRLARLLRSDRGNGLLVGVSGMGKQSLTKLAAHVNEYKCMQIELKRNYDSVAFHEDLKVIYRMAGIENTPVVFLMVDSQIVEEEFLEDINNILNSGEVPNLFEGDDFEKLILDAREACNEANKTGCTRDEIYKYFINRVRNNLHVVLSMSPVGDAFRRRCRMFPSLVNCTTIDWFSNWPTEALFSVALEVLQEISKKKEEREALAHITVFMHKTVEDASVMFYKEMKRHYYTTPSSYLELLKLYKSLLKVKTDEIIAKRKRIANGLNKILQTNEIIAVMQKELEVMVPELDLKSDSMKTLLDRLAVDTKMADQVKDSVMRDESVAKDKASICQAISDDASKDLEIAMPALQEAEVALNSLSKADINELKSFTTPPALVQFCMEAVCLLMGAKPSWAAAKQLMADVNFLKHLIDYDKEHIKDEIIKKLKKYIEHKDFVPAKFEKVSKVAKSVSMWVIAMDKFAKIYKVVEPKIKRKEAAEAELSEVMLLLRRKQQELAAVEAKIQMLKDNLDQKSHEFQIIQDSVDLTYGRIHRAGRLTSALADEEIRWKETVQNLTHELICVPGDVLVSAACVAYLGAFSIEYRRELTQQWAAKCQEHKIPSSGKFNLLKVLGDAYEMRQWTMDGLPKDNISVENGLYATRALRWPLMIDPQEQANRWIRNKERANNLYVLKMTDSTLMRVLENCIRQGYPVLLEDIDETIDPSIRPVLQRETFVQEGRVYLKLGDVIIDYDKNFKLYMTTKLANPHYLPEICINVTLVNFLVTESGLEDQLLADIVAIELPALEIQRNDLVVKINTDKQQLLALEDKVLKLLFNSQGNILDDEELVETLNDAKETSLIIATRLIDTEETEKVITATRENYRTLASRGAILYFVVAGLAEVDPMYQYSLKYFSQVFCNVIRQEHEKMNIEDRIAYLKLNELKAIYDNISRGLFENHKIIFSFLLAMAIERQENRVNAAEFNFLTRGVVGGVSNPKPLPPGVKLTETEWEACLYLEEHFAESFKGFTSQIAIPFFLQISENKEVFNLANATGNISDVWNLRLNLFEKLMLIKSLRKERFLLNVVAYLQGTIGRYFTEASAAGSKLSVVYLDTSCITPLVFVLSSGSDPMANFLKFAEEMKYLDKFHSISLGQGQGPIAESLFDKSLRSGLWLFLQNCHLATSWMHQLETIVRNISLGIIKSHEQFRLFLSSMPTKNFPISVLQNSVKLTNEPPKSIKANVLGALNDLSREFFEQHVLQEKWRAIVFGLCMFHAVILERRKFGPLGWNILYEFTESDRECGLKTLEFFISRNVVDEEIPWDAIFYINGEITWGGRVTDYWDLRCLRTVLKTFSSERILDPKYKYCSGDPYYRDPRKKKLSAYQEYVQNFPALEDPEIFGMNQNANIVFQAKETEFFISCLLMGQPRAVTDEGQAEVNDKTLDIIAKIQEVLVLKIRRDDMNPALSQVDDKGQLPSLTTVLVQEVDRYNIFLSIVHDSLVNLAKAIKGLVVMSEVLEEVFTALLTNMVPKVWTKKSFLSIKPLPSFIADFQRRIDFIECWLTDGNPRSYWISGFYFPQSFLTGVLQTHARKRTLPIDSLKIDFVIIDRYLIQQNFFERRQAKSNYRELYGDIPESSEVGVNAHGIFVEAARWSTNEGGLCDAYHGELYTRMPTVRFIPCLEMEPGNRYDAPLYKTQARSGVLSTTGHSTNFILSILLESKYSPDFWILRGTALVSGVAENIT